MTPFKVICVDDSPHNGCSAKLLSKGKKYFVIDIKKAPDGRDQYVLDEIWVIASSGQRLRWLASRFRRLDEYPSAMSDILKDFNPDKVEQEVYNPQKVEV